MRARPGYADILADRIWVALHSGQLTFDMSECGDSNVASQFVQTYS